MSPLSKAVVGVGSNIQADKYIPQAYDLLNEQHSIVQSSSFVKTKPVGYLNQADFTNGAWLVQTQLSYAKFNEYLKSIEDQLGRFRSLNRNGPRCIDLDILLWNGQLVDDDVHKRDFLKNSLEELGFGIPS